MFYIVEIDGCEPYLSIPFNEDTGESLAFETEKKAEAYAQKNCAWDYRIIEF